MDDNVIELEVGAGPRPGEYTVRVLRSAAGGEPIGTLAIDVEELLAQRPQIESTVLSSSVSARRVTPVGEQPIQRLGLHLFESLFAGSVGGAYRGSLGASQEHGQSLRVVLRLTAPGLAAVPWETLFDPETGAYLCRKEPLIRHVQAPFTPDALTVSLPLRILGLVASPRGLPVLDVEAEQRRLAEALQPHIDAGRVELVWLADVSWEGLHAALLGGEWHVLHFIGHGDYDTATDEGVLALVGKDGRADFVDASSLADLFDEAEPTPRLVVLNSCLSGAAGGRDIFSGTAAALVRSGIHAVAAMQFAISDVAAIAFARGFYTSLASGRSIDEAVRSGRIGILGIRGTLEWLTPVLYLRGDATKLFAFDPGNASEQVGGLGPPKTLPPSPDGVTPATVQPEPQGPSVTTSPGIPGDTEQVGTRRPRRRLLTAIAAGIVVVAGAVTAALVLPGDGDSGGGGGTDSVAGPVEVTIPSTELWTDTGVSCEEGDQLDITATGTILHNEDDPASEVDPDGIENPSEFFLRFNVIPNTNTAALIGSLDRASLFVVGSAVTHTCPKAGELFLGINDIGVGNNSGEFVATIVKRAG